MFCLWLLSKIRFFKVVTGVFDVCGQTAAAVDTKHGKAASRKHKAAGAGYLCVYQANGAPPVNNFSCGLQNALPRAFTKVKITAEGDVTPVVGTGRDPCGNIHQRKQGPAMNHAVRVKRFGAHDKPGHRRIGKDLDDLDAVMFHKFIVLADRVDTSLRFHIGHLSKIAVMVYEKEPGEILNKRGGRIARRPPERKKLALLHKVLPAVENFVLKTC